MPLSANPPSLHLLGSITRSPRLHNFSLSTGAYEIMNGPRIAFITPAALPLTAPLLEHLTAASTGTQLQQSATKPPVVGDVGPPAGGAASATGASTGANAHDFMVPVDFPVQIYFSRPVTAHKYKVQAMCGSRLADLRDLVFEGSSLRCTIAGLPSSCLAACDSPLAVSRSGESLPAACQAGSRFERDINCGLPAHVYLALYFFCVGVDEACPWSAAAPHPLLVLPEPAADELAAYAESVYSAGPVSRAALRSNALSGAPAVRASPQNERRLIQFHDASGASGNVSESNSERIMTASAVSPAASQQAVPAQLSPDAANSTADSTQEAINHSTFALPPAFAAGAAGVRQPPPRQPMMEPLQEEITSIQFLIADIEMCLRLAARHHSWTPKSGEPSHMQQITSPPQVVLGAASQLCEQLLVRRLFKVRSKFELQIVVVYL